MWFFLALFTSLYKRKTLFSPLTSRYWQILSEPTNCNHPPLLWQSCLAYLPQTGLLLVQSLSHVQQYFVTPQTAALQTSLSFTISWSLLKLMSIELLSHPTISSSVTHFSSGLQSFPASGSFPMSPLFASGGQSIETSALASVLPMNIQGWFPLGLTLQFKGLSRVFSTTTVQKYQFFSPQPSYICTWLWEKPQPWLGGPLLAKWCLCFLIHCLGLS